MTKAEILKALEECEDDEEILVLLWSADGPSAKQLGIQKIEYYKGWHGSRIMGIQVSEDNSTFE